MAERERDGMMLLLLRSPDEVIEEGVVRSLTMEYDEDDPDEAIINVHVEVRADRPVEKVRIHIHGLKGVIESEENSNLLDPGFTVSNNKSAE